jgi:hypothetical protein
VFPPILPPKGTPPPSEAPWWAAGRNWPRPFHQLIEISKGSLQALTPCTSRTVGPPIWARRPGPSRQLCDVEGLQATQIAEAMQQNAVCTCNPGCSDTIWLSVEITFNKRFALVITRHGLRAIGAASWTASTRYAHLTANQLSSSSSSSSCVTQQTAEGPP